MQKRLIFNFIIAITGLICFPSFSMAEKSINVHLEPRTIEIGASYNGAQISVLGEIPRDAEVLVQMRGAGHDAELLKKGRVMGFLWMNTGSIVFHNVPSIYKLYLPAAIKEESISQGKQWDNLDVGFGSLKKKADITPANEDKDLQFKEFVKLKTKGEFYSVVENAVVYQDAEDNMKSFSCRLSVPCALPHGTYAVEALILKDGVLLKKEQKQFEIKETGLPALISSIAFKHGTIYGILATIIALGAGLVMGTLFKGAQGGH